ncbi:MAG: hypothetical protein FWF06_03120 [Symbiobacteriaceae bacterium]|nr:hypothetical protein [Symbiobacteriaceae bacterium]
MEKPVLSPQFTVEDIGKLREWNYERTKNMTDEERRADLRHDADFVREMIAKAKRKRQAEEAKTVV